MKDIIGISKEMTKEEFIKGADKSGYCPHMYGLQEFDNECSYGETETCHECFNAALRDIKFKDE